LSRPRLTLMNGEVPVVRIEGLVDAIGAPELERRLTRLLEGQSMAVFDVAAARFADKTAALVMTRLRDIGLSDVALVAPDSTLARTLAELGTPPPAFASVEDAVTDLARQALRSMLDLDPGPPP
jgi:anti-anti-sigma regulatory factor